MYGIRTQDGLRVLCQRTGTNVYILKEWSRASMPAMRESPMEIDQLLQDYMTASGLYNLEVFQFTQDEVEALLIKKLQGY